MTERAAAEFVMSTLRKAGFEAFLAGGCVRDLVLGREPKDFDVTTNARPEQVAPLFEKTIPVGAAFGVVVVMVEDYQFEVATYRTDGQYSDGRRPDSVAYSDSAEEDVKRRDFTMNGLLTDNVLAAPFITEAVIDYVGGKEDIKNRLIRCIGNPFDRFKEDALRMLRAVRFAAQLGFTIEAGTYDAIVANVDLIRNVSRERIRMELEKLVSAPFPTKGLVPLVSSGLFTVLFAETEFNTGTHFVDEMRFQRTLQRFSRFTTKSPQLGMAMLFADCSDNPAVKAALESLKFSNEDETEIFNAVINQQQGDGVDRFNMSDADVKLLARVPGVLKYGIELWHQTAQLFFAYTFDAAEARVTRFQSLAPEDIRPVPMVTGKDLIAMGFTPGPAFTTVLREVEYRQLNGDFKDAAQALEFAKAKAEAIAAPPTSLWPKDYESSRSGIQAVLWSVMSGCPIGCRFCGTGDYFVRNLTSEEIVAQVERCLQETGIDPATMKRLQVMTMSMGEPMLNLKALIPALETLYSRYPNAALLVSTSAPRIDYSEFMAAAYRIPTIGLQFSVHESTDEGRDALIPFKSKLTLAEIADHGDWFYTTTHRKAFFNYCAHDGNTSDMDAHRIAQLFDPGVFCATISVICERDESVAAANARQFKLATDFASKLVSYGYNTRVFNPAGQDDIGGDCGQLWFV